MKQFLKCSHCGHLNEMTSEYMVFCSSCGKKMENNFTEWQRRNPGNSFEDYKQKACMSENQIPPEIPQKKKNSLKSRSLKEKILIVVITALSAAAGGWLADTAIHAIRNNRTTHADILEQPWVKKTYEDYGLTLETPGALSKMQLPPEQRDALKELTISMDMYESADDNTVKVTLNMSKYKPEIEFNLQGGALGTINSLKNQPNITQFVYDEQSYQLDTIPGYIQKGSFLLNGVKAVFTSIGLFKEDTYYQMIILTKANDEIAKTAAERIINSIEIK